MRLAPSGLASLCCACALLSATLSRGGLPPLEAQTREDGSPVRYFYRIPVLIGRAKLQNPLYAHTINSILSGRFTAKHVPAVPYDTPLPISRVRRGTRGGVRKSKLDAF
jgi:hypothetical protein